MRNSRTQYPENSPREWQNEMSHPAQQRLRRGGLRAMLAFSVFALAACDKTTTPEATEEERLETPTPADVADEPASYLGKRLTLIGEVEQVNNPRAFQLAGNTELLGNDLLVVAKSPVRFGNQPLAEDDDVVVVGRVSRLDVMEIERELQWDLDTELEVEWENKAVLIAESVSKVGRYARWSETKDDDGVWLGLTSIFLAPDPESFIGDRIELDAAPIQDVIGDGIWLGHSTTSRVLVMPGQGTSATGLLPGKLVDVEGTLRKMPDVETSLAKLRLTGSQSDEAKRQLEGEYLYIEASAISIDRDAESEASAAGDELSFDSFRATSSEHLGRGVRGEAAVSGVVSERAFWLEAQSGQDILGIVEGNAERAPLTLGQRVRFKATAKTPAQIQLASFKLPAAAKKQIESEKVVLAMAPENVEIVGQGPGAPPNSPPDPASTNPSSPSPASTAPDGVIRLPATGQPPEAEPSAPIRPNDAPPTDEDPATEPTAPRATSKARAQRTPAAE